MRLAISGACFDGDAGVVILDENFQVAKRIDGITIRGDEDIAKIRGSVFPASPILFTGTAANKNEDLVESIGLYDADREAWAAEPTDDYCYTECTDGEHAVYYLGNWPEWYDENGTERYKAVVRVYADTGELLRTETLTTPEAYDELFSSTSRHIHVESTWNDEEDTATYDSGTGITLTLHYDDDPVKNTAVLKQNGKVVAESSSMTIRPFMVDESDEDFIPFRWLTVSMTNSFLDADGEPTYEDAGFLIADRDGRIVYREDKSSSYYPTLIDENFCVFYDWNSCKYIIRDYSGRELFSWIRPDQYEYW